MQQELTVDELRAIMIQAAGDWPVPDGGDADTSYCDLGFDSLARLETLVRIERLIGTRLPEDLIQATSTPREVIDKVNALVGVG